MSSSIFPKFGIFVELHWVRPIKVSKIHKVVFIYWNSLKVRGCLPCWLSSLEVVFPGGRLPNFQIFQIVLMCTGVDLQMLQSKLCWFPAISLLVWADGWPGGRVAGLIKIKANSAQLNWGWGWAWQKDKWHAYVRPVHFHSIGSFI